jgi:methanol--5-hydroxybenzimidazolylcobamide Co-methyltransferase
MSINVSSLDADFATRASLSTARTYDSLAIKSLDDFIYGHAPYPVSCGRGLTIGSGTVIPEINFTLPPIDINAGTWPEIRNQYQEMITKICERAVSLEVPGLLVEFETLPPMTVKPEWGAEITQILADELRRVHDKYGLPNALRLTPNDSRDHLRPPKMRSGFYWDGMVSLFNRASDAGADLMAIESTGGKEICDEALMNADLRRMVYALGVLAPRDMAFLWQEIVAACSRGGIVPSGDTACGFANTAMVLAHEKMVPKVFAAVVRVASVPRGLVAYAMGAVGPSKDCAYEGPYMKAITGVPISMEGRSAACAHLSAVGNISQAVCDCWSNESVQNVRLLSAIAPVVSLEQLAYDCRLINTASKTTIGAQRMRDWLVESDSASDPQAYVLRPDVVLRLSREMISETDAYRQTRRGILATIAELRRASGAGELFLVPNEVRWLDRLWRQADSLPESESEFIESMAEELVDAPYLPEEYGL